MHRRGGFFCILLLVSSGLLLGQDRGRVLDNLQSDVGDLRERLRHFKVERELLEDRIQAQAQELSDLKKELSRFQTAQNQLTGSKSDQLQTRIGMLEKGQGALVDDLKGLQKHLTETSQVINRLSDHVEQNQSALKAQVTDLKKAVESLVGLLQKNSSSATHAGSSYKVKAGDTLEKIAKATGVSLSHLKKLNNLSTDRISIGQELYLE